MNPLAAAALGGVLGWGLLAVVTPEDPLYSKAFGRAKVPFLPVFAAGGAAIALAAPHLRHLNMLERAAIYGLGATALELGACALDRQLLRGEPAWNYSPKGSPQNLLGCVDIKHSLAWTALALGFERII